MEYLVVLRILIMLAVSLVFLYFVARQTNKIKRVEEMKEALNEALTHIQDTIDVGENLNKVDVERLERAQTKINNVLNAEKQKKKG